MDVVSKDTACIDINSLQDAATTTHQANLASTASTVDFNLDDLLDSHDFLLPVESQNFNEDSLLYYVEQGELLRLTSPFMVSGIYKKIASTTEAADAPKSADANASKNVFITEDATRGRIICAKDYSQNDEGNHVDSTEARAPPAATKQLLYMEDVLNSASDMLETAQNLVTKVAKNAETKKQWDALAKMAYNIFRRNYRDHIVIDRTRNEILRTAFGTNEKTIYRFLAPESLQLKPPKESSVVQSNSDLSIPSGADFVRNKRGRPRKQPQSQEQSQPVAKARKRDPEKQQEAQTKAADSSNTATQPATGDAKTTTCTRSGRVVKLLHNNLKNLSNGEVNLNRSDELKEFLADIRDATFHYTKPIKPVTNFSTSLDDYPPMNLNNEEELLQPLATSSPTKRTVPANAICPTCKKIFLGRRLQRHYLQHPDHVQPPKALTNECNDEISLFRFLMSKLQKSNLNEDQRAEIFLHEINDFVEQLQLRSSRLIRNTSGLHFVTPRTARVLGIPEGQYALDMSAFEAPLEPEFAANGLNEQINSHALAPQSTSLSLRNLDYAGLSMSLDDEAAQKLNLSAGGKLLPPSEESLLRNVVDLVPNSIKKLGATALLDPRDEETTSNIVDGPSLVVVPHYDHVSDNAVEATTMKETPSSTVASSPLLELAVDFFQFKKN